MYGKIKENTAFLQLLTKNIEQMNGINERIAKAVEVCTDGNKRKFAEKVGTTDTSIGKWMSTDRTPDVNIVANMCRSFNISADWILLGEGDMFKSNQTISIHTSGHHNASGIGNIINDNAVSIEYLMKRIEDIESKNSKLQDALISLANKL